MTSIAEKASSTPSTEHRVAVVVPCFRVSRQIMDVLARVGSETSAIYVVDDTCPEHTGALVERQSSDPRVRVLRHAANQGVGGATMTGYRQAAADGAAVVVKLDGDGQMDPREIPRLIRPVLAGEADYAKGNRFFNPEDLTDMPKLRLVGNACLSFLTKAASGYWDLFDPTNGFTAIDARLIAHLPLAKISRRFFFESDLLFRLNTLRAVVTDIPMPARYGDERSNLRPLVVGGEFLAKNLRNLGKRIIYSYFLRNFSSASVELVLSLILGGFGIAFGVLRWWAGIQAGAVATSGTVMLAALPLLFGFQLFLAFLSYDMQNVPRRPIARRL